LKKYNKKEIEIMEEPDNETVEIDSELVRTREHRSRQRKIVGAMKRLGAPDILIKYQEWIATLTYSQYEYEKTLEREQIQKEKAEYCKTRKMNDAVVQALFDRFDCMMELDENVILNGSRVLFDSHLDPLAVMPEKDYDMDLYEPLLHSFFKQYCDKWKIGMDYWNDDEDNIVVTDNQKNTSSSRRE